VGIETIDRPVSLETAFAVSIAEPPPSAISPSAPPTAARAAFTPAISACARTPWKRSCTGS
jgi:hypothetical protein